jgi:hypothetical protein
MLYVLKGHKILDVIMCGTIFVCCVALFPSFDFIVSRPGRRRDHMKAHSIGRGGFAILVLARWSTEIGQEKTKESSLSIVSRS